MFRHTFQENICVVALYSFVNWLISRQSPNQQARGAFNVVKEKMGIRGTVGQRVISGRTHYHTNVKIEDIKGMPELV